MSSRLSPRFRLGGILIGALALLTATTPAAAAPVGIGTADAAGPTAAGIAGTMPGIVPADPVDPPEEQEPGPVEVVLESVTPEVIRPGDDLTFAGSIRNHTDEDLTSAVVWVRMQRHVPTDEGLSRWLDGTSSTNVAVIARARLDEPGPGSADFEITLGEDESPFLEGSTWGPHGIEIAVETNLGSNTTRSTMTWFPSQAPEGSPASLTTLVPLQPTTAEWSEALAADGTVADAAAARLDGVLGALEDSAVTWALDPVLLEAGPISTEDVHQPEEDPQEADSPAGGAPPPDLQVAGFAADVARAAADHPVLDLGYAAPDYQALLAGGSDAGGQLLTVGAARAADLFSAAGIDRIAETIWPGVELSESSREWLAAEHRLTIRTPTRSADSSYTSTAGTSMTTLTGNYRLSAALLTEHDAGERRELVARSAIAVRATPDVPILLTLPRGLDATQAGQAQANLTRLAQLPWFTPRDLPDLTETPLPLRPDASSSEEPAGAPATTGALEGHTIDAIATDVETVLTIAALTDDPASFGGGYLPELIGATAASWRADPARRAELIADVRGRAARLETAIQVETPSTINLISRGGEVPITIANALPQAVNVAVELVPGDARLRADDPVAARLPEESASTVRVPIHAVANGNVEVGVRVLDAEGEEVAEPIRFSIRVRADWEDTGTAIVAGGLLALFVFGLARTIRRGRRRAEG